MIPALHHHQMAPHVRFSGAFCIDPSNRMETRLLDFRILACHPLLCVKFPRVFSIPTWLRQTPYIPRIHKTPWPCSSTRRYCGPCRVFEQFGDVNPHCCRTGNLGPPLRKNGRLIASGSRRSPSGTSCHTPGCRRPFSAWRGNRCLRSAGSAATNATPGRPKSGQPWRSFAESASGGQVGGLAAAAPPRGPPRS